MSLLRKMASRLSFRAKKGRRRYTEPITGRANESDQFINGEVLSPNEQPSFHQLLHVETKPSAAACEARERKTRSELEVAVNHGVHVTASTGACNTDVAAYEDRIEELGQLMQERGRCLDELTHRSHQLSTENTMLREKLSTDIGNLVSKSNTFDSSSMTSQKRSPLKNISSQQKYASGSSASNDNQSKLFQKCKDENELLLQQSDLLAKELTHANEQLADRDASLATLGKELSTCMEKARNLAVEKKSWKREMIQKSNEVEALEASVKRANAVRSELSSRTEQLLAERKDFEEEADNLRSQVDHSASKMEDMHAQLASKQTEINALEKKCQQLQRELLESKQEARTNAESIHSMKENLRQSKSQNDRHESALREIQKQLEASKRCRHKLETMCDGLQAETKAMVERHKQQISNWTKGQSKLVSSLKQQHSADKQQQEKLIDSLQRTNSVLDHERARYQRDQQSLERKCSELEKLIESVSCDQNQRQKELLQRAAAAENNLEKIESMESEWKAKVTFLDGEVVRCQDAARDLELQHKNVVDGLERELRSIKQENESLADQIRSLTKEVDSMRQSFMKDKQSSQLTMEHRMREAELACEAMRMQMEQEAHKTKEMEHLHEQKSMVQQSKIDQMKADQKLLREQLEKKILEEREVSQRLMAKVQELNQTIQSFTAERLQSVAQIKRQHAKISKLERIVSSSEIKLSNLGKQLSKSVEEQERQIRREGELKVELHQAVKILEKMKVGNFFGMS